MIRGNVYGAHYYLTVLPEVHRQSLLVRVYRQDVQAIGIKKSIYHPQIDTYGIHNWSPLKSPNATIRSPSLMPAEPASRREFFVNRLGENGHIDATGEESSNRVSVRYAGMDSNGLCVCALQDLKNELVMVNLESR